MKKIVFSIFLCLASLLPAYRFFAKFSGNNLDVKTHAKLPFWDSFFSGSTDYMYFWGTGKFINEGFLNRITDVQLYWNFLQSHVTHGISLGLWAYPPTFNFIICLMALLPFFKSYLIFMFLSISFAFFSFQKQYGKLTAVLLLLSPVAFTCYHYGQLGVVVASIVSLALFLDKPEKINFKLDNNVISGILFALCTMKYPFVILIPFYLLFSKSWKTLSVTVVSTLLLCLSSLLVFGVQAWTDYLHIAAPAMVKDMETSMNVLFLSILPAFVYLGVPHSIAWLSQAILSIGCVFILWYSIKNKIFIKEELIMFVLGITLITTPYSHTYDLILIAPALLNIIIKLNIKNSKKEMFYYALWFLIGSIDFLGLFFDNLSKALHNGPHLYVSGVPLFSFTLITIILITFWKLRTNPIESENQENHIISKI